MHIARRCLAAARFPAAMILAAQGCANVERAIPTTHGPSQVELDAPRPTDWLGAGRDYAGTKYSPLARISVANVATLRPVCSYPVGDRESFQTMPLVHRGTMYVTTARLTLALDAATCRLRWRHEWNATGADRNPRNRGVALKDGRVVRGTTDGHLIALDAGTGALLWARRAADSRRGETFTMPPLVFENLVIIGPGIGEHAIGGWIGAFRLTDGQPVWRFRTIDERSWPSRQAAAVGGAAVWTPVALDRHDDLLYVATGNPTPGYAGDVRAGANLYSNTLLALDVRSGTLRWFRQMVVHDTHDWDFTQAGPLFRLPVGDTIRDLVSTAGKDGMLRILDRTSHELLYEVPVTTRRNVEQPVRPDGTYACPGTWGGVQWNGPAYHPGLGMLFVNAVDWCSTFTAGRDVRRVPGRNYVGGRTVQDARNQAAGWLTAVDAATGRIRWRYRSPAPLLAAIATTAGGLLFTGELTGDVLALEAATGSVRYRFNTGLPIGGGVVTYESAGVQYVAVMAGRPSPNFVAPTMAGRATVIVFGLP
jgi:alcohol dehydrogenase (cytochrome c)